MRNGGSRRHGGCTASVCGYGYGLVSLSRPASRPNHGDLLPLPPADHRIRIRPRRAQQNAPLRGVGWLAHGGTVLGSPGARTNHPGKTTRHPVDRGEPRAIAPAAGQAISLQWRGDTPFPDPARHRVPLRSMPRVKATPQGNPLHPVPVPACCPGQYPAPANNRGRC